MSLPRQGKSPRIAPTAYLARNPVVSCNVTIGSECQSVRGTWLPARRKRKREACEPFAWCRAQRHHGSAALIQAHREAMPAP